MHGSNKFLFGIVVGILLLVIVAFSVIMLRPETAYLDDSTPDGAAHNYLLALHNGDFERAYQALPSDYKFPTDAADLEDDIRGNAYQFDLDEDFSLSVESTRMRGEDKAVVTIRKTTFEHDGLFGNRQYSRTFTMDMVRENTVWKVGYARNYWLKNCWGYSEMSHCRN